MTYYRPPTTAGDVVPFRQAPKVPTLTIGGRKYALSTDGGPFGDREDDDLMEESPLGARLIRPPSGSNKWRYLWVLNTDRKNVVMWRVSDGDEKLEDSARSQQARIVALEKKGQLNRVTDSEFRKVDAEMRRRGADLLKSLQDGLEASKDEATRLHDRLVGEFYESKVLPTLLRELRAVREGAVPIGFRPHGPALEGDEEWLLRQRSSHVLGNVLRRLMPVEAVEKWLVSEGFDLGLVDIQATEWAVQDVYDKAAKLLPERPKSG